MDHLRDRAEPDRPATISTPVYLAGIIWLLGYRNLVGLVGTAAGMTAVLYLVFGRALHVLVPMGPLGR